MERRLSKLWNKGREFLGVRYPLISGAMTWISDSRLVRKVGEDATKDDRIADLIARAQKTVPGLMRDRAFKVYNNLSHLGTNVIPVMQALRAITRRQGAAISEVQIAGLLVALLAAAPGRRMSGPLRPRAPRRRSWRTLRWAGTLAWGPPMVNRK